MSVLLQSERRPRQEESLPSDAPTGSTHVRNSEEAELQHSRDGPLDVVPVGCVVAQPVTRVLSHAGEGGAGQHQGAVVPKDLLQGPEYQGRGGGRGQRSARQG